MSEFGRNPVTDLFPRNGFCLAGIEVRDAAGDFHVPGGFYGFGIVLHVIQTFQQRARRFSALFRRKREGFLQQVRGFVSHAVTILQEISHGKQKGVGFQFSVLSSQSSVTDY